MSCCPRWHSSFRQGCRNKSLGFFEFRFGFSFFPPWRMTDENSQVWKVHRKPIPLSYFIYTDFLFVLKINISTLLFWFFLGSHVPVYEVVVGFFLSLQDKFCHINLIFDFCQIIPLLLCEGTLHIKVYENFIKKLERKQTTMKEYQFFSYIILLIMSEW